MSFQAVLCSLLFIPIFVPVAEATQFCDRTGCRPMVMEQHRQTVLAPASYSNFQPSVEESSIYSESLRATPIRTPLGHLHAARPRFVQQSAQTTVSSSIRLHME